MKSRKPWIAPSGALTLAVAACAPPNARVVTAPQAPAATSHLLEQTGDVDYAQLPVPGL